MSAPSFSNALDSRRAELPVWPRPTYVQLLTCPILEQGYDADLRLELDHPYPLRYWTSRVQLHDRPTTHDGYFVGPWPRVEVEACIEGSWVLIDGYQGIIA